MNYRTICKASLTSQSRQLLRTTLTIPHRFPSIPSPLLREFSFSLCMCQVSNWAPSRSQLKHSHGSGSQGYLIHLLTLLNPQSSNSFRLIDYLYITIVSRREDITHSIHLNKSSSVKFSHNASNPH